MAVYCSPWIGLSSDYIDNDRHRLGFQIDNWNDAAAVQQAHIYGTFIDAVNGNRPVDISYRWFESGLSSDAFHLPGHHSVEAAIEELRRGLKELSTEGFTEAPIDGSAYVRKDSSWEPLADHLGDTDLRAVGFTYGHLKLKSVSNKGITTATLRDIADALEIPTSKVWSCGRT